VRGCWVATRCYDEVCESENGPDRNEKEEVRVCRRPVAIGAVPGGYDVGHQAEHKDGEESLCYAKRQGEDEGHFCGCDICTCSKRRVFGSLVL